MLPNPAVVDCLRANPYKEPRARATVIRGRQNDTLILDWALSAEPEQFHNASQRHSLTTAGAGTGGDERIAPSTDAGPGHAARESLAR